MLVMNFPLEIVEKVVELMRERSSQAEIESSKYVGDEFHFRLRAPAVEIPDVSDQDTKVSMIGPSYELIKIRKENGVWRVYDTVYDHDRMKSEMPDYAPLRLARKPIPKTSQGEWFYPFAFFIACSRKNG